MLVLSCSQQKRSPSHWDFSDVPISIFRVEPPQCVCDKDGDCAWWYLEVCTEMNVLSVFTAFTAQFSSSVGQKCLAAFINEACIAVLPSSLCLLSWSTRKGFMLFLRDCDWCSFYFTIHYEEMGTLHKGVMFGRWRKRSDVLVLVLYRVLFSVTSALDFSYHYKKIHGGCCGWGLRTLFRVIVWWGDPIWSAGPSAEILHLHQSAVTHFCLSYIHWTRDRSLWASAVALCRCSSAVRSCLYCTIKLSFILMLNWYIGWVAGLYKDAFISVVSYSKLSHTASLPPCFNTL